MTVQISLIVMGKSLRLMCMTLKYKWRSNIWRGRRRWARAVSPFLQHNIPRDMCQGSPWTVSLQIQLGQSGRTLDLGKIGKVRLEPGLSQTDRVQHSCSLVTLWLKA